MNPNFRVVALDPGGTTGWAQYDAEYDIDPEDDSKTVLVEQNLTVGHLGPGAHHDDLFGLLETAMIPRFAVVCESFEFRQGRQRDNIVLDSVEYIGVTKLFCEQRGIKPFMQTAGLGKGFTDDKKLKIMGWYHPGWKHANDATRHLVYHLVNRERRFDLIESWRQLT